MQQVQHLAKILKVLSVEARIRIVQMLKRQALCVGALSARLDITQGAVSQHLRILKDAGLVTAEKRGYYVHYRLNEDVLANWKNAIDALVGAESRSPRGPAAGKKMKGTKQCLMKRKAVRSPKS